MLSTLCSERGDVMKKCIRITVSGVRDPDAFTERVKHDVNTNGVEGVVDIIVPDMVELVAYGPKEQVDLFVNEVEGVVITYNIKKRDHASFAVEPYFKEEDYRGVVRFLKKSAHGAH